MLQSMTGFGKSEVILNGQLHSISVKSLNSKNIEINCKLPMLLREKELDIRQIVAQTLVRGKIDVIVYSEENDNEHAVQLNKKVAARYVDEINNLCWSLQLAPPSDYVSLILKMPYVLATPEEELSDEDWKNFTLALNQALDAVQQWRSAEGKTIMMEFHEYLNQCIQYLNEVEQYAPVRSENIKQKLIEQLQSLQSTDFDRNRLEQELVYYLEKINIEEELVRARSHIQYFLETMQAPQSHGKKLNFIAQEILRELNTMGTKASDVHIQRLVVEMKDLTEKIRQQLANVL